MSEPTYDHDKFAEMLVYIVSRVEGEPTNGDTKLNKLLYYADVTAFRRTGRAISGARYQHQTHGPTARPLIPVRNEDLVGRLEVSEKRLPNGAVQRRTRATDDSDTAVFSEGEVAIMDEVVDRFQNCRAEEMANFAHKGAAWMTTQDGDDMLYRSALVVRDASPAAVKYGEELATSLGR